jgi:hypothetical protein
MKKIVYKDDIVEYKNFLTKEECETLISYYDSSIESWQETCFYNARVMDPSAPMVKNIYPNINEEYFIDLRNKLSDIAEEVFGKKVKNLSLSAHKWLPGAFASDHSDNSELDGTPNAWRENKLVTIIYLNDNYQGGNLYFRDHGLSIAPEAGSMICFDVGIDNVHGVTEIESGDRYTMLLSWDFADSVYPPEYFAEKEKELEDTRIAQEKQREEWKKGNIHAGPISKA